MRGVLPVTCVGESPLTAVFQRCTTGFRKLDRVSKDRNRCTAAVQSDEARSRNWPVAVLHPVIVNDGRASDCCLWRLRVAETRQAISEHRSILANWLLADKAVEKKLAISLNFFRVPS